MEEVVKEIVESFAETVGSPVISVTLNAPISC